MNDMPRPSVASVPTALLSLRPRHGFWVYLLWLAVYVAAAVGIVADAWRTDARLGTAQYAMLLVPVVVTVFQWAYPTLLGWGVVQAFSALYCGFLLVRIVSIYVLTTRWELEDALVAVAYLAVCLGVCVALFLVVLPRIAEWPRPR